MAATVLRVLALSTVAQFVVASSDLVSIPFPNPDGFPVSAQVLGVDSQGHTTYALVEVDVVGTSTSTLFTETIVAGSDYVSATVSVVNSALSVVGGFACTINGANAVCAEGGTATATIPTQSLGFEVLDIASGTAASPTATGATGGAGAGASGKQGTGAAQGGNGAAGASNAAAGSSNAAAAGASGASSPTATGTAAAPSGTPAGSGQRASAVANVVGAALLSLLCVAVQAA